MDKARANLLATDLDMRSAFNIRECAALTNGRCVVF